MAFSRTEEAILRLHPLLYLCAEPAQLVHRLRVRVLTELELPIGFNLALVDVGFPPAHTARKSNGRFVAKDEPSLVTSISCRDCYSRSCRTPPLLFFFSFCLFPNPRNHAKDNASTHTSDVSRGTVLPNQSQAGTCRLCWELAEVGHTNVKGCSGGRFGDDVLHSSYDQHTPS